MMWILGSVWMDMFFLVIPALATLIIFFSNILTPGLVGVAGLIVFTWIDSGHIYITTLRTYTHPKELATSAAYIFAPIIIFFILALWLVSGGYYIWSFIIYATLFHNVRQFYGISRWYQKNIQCPHIIRTQMLYVLTLAPVLLYHFRTDVPTDMYSKQDIFLYSNQTVFNFGFTLYIMFLLGWLIYELNLLLQRKENIAVFISLLVPALAYGLGFIFGKNLFQILGPIIVSHGVSYWALTSLSVKRTRGDVFKSLSFIFIVGLGIAILLGTLEGSIEDYFLTQYVDNQKLSLSICLGLAAILTPLLVHFYLDAKIWNGKHRESHLVFKNKV